MARMTADPSSPSWGASPSLPLPYPDAACATHGPTGIDVTVVSRVLGHSSIETIARYYLRPDLDVTKKYRYNGPTLS